MSNLFAGNTPGPGLGAAAPKTVVTRSSDYLEAQRAVDYLSDHDFPVQNTAIVGRDVRIVERVSGRLTASRAAGLGAAGGAWWGLFFGLLFGLFAPGLNFIGIMLIGLGLGAIWGAITGWIAHRLTGGRRDFSSTRGIDAGSWEVTVADEHLGRARQLLLEGGFTLV